MRGGREAREQRHLLLPALHALQAAVGWISEGGLNYVCERLSVPPAEAYGVATFYAMFSVEERPANVVHVCDDLACRERAGSRSARSWRATPRRGADAGGWTWVRSPCLGMCEQAPAVFAQRAGRPEVALGGATRATVDAIVAPDSDGRVRRRGRARRRRSRPTGASDLRLLRARRRRRSRRRSTTTARTAATRRSRARSSSGPRR